MERITFNFSEAVVVNAFAPHHQDDEEESFAYNATMPEIRREAERLGLSLQQLLIFLLTYKA